MPERPYLLFIDNFDSFTFNLVDASAATGADCEVVRNDSPVDALMRRARDRRCRLLVLSPGPGTPRDAGCCLDLLRTASATYPVLGICLGHQAIVEAFGGEIGPAPAVVHGKASPVRHQGHPLFDGLPPQFPVGRYHSLAARRVPECLDVIAREGDLVMAVAHRSLPVYGLQFHPESILTAAGPRILRNALDLALLSAPSRSHSAPCTLPPPCIPA